jgi:hypothetical protein
LDAGQRCVTAKSSCFTTVLSFFLALFSFAAGFLAVNFLGLSWRYFSGEMSGLKRDKPPREKSSFAGLGLSLGLNVALHWESDTDRNTAVSSSPYSSPFSRLLAPATDPGIEGIMK